MDSTTLSTSSSRVGLIPGVAHLAIDVVDRTQKTTIGLMQDVRGELRTTLDGTIELAEKTTLAAMRLSRKLVQRLDDAIAQTLGNAEKLLDAAMLTARDTTRAANKLATTTFDGVIGPRGAVSTPSASA